MLCLQAVQGGVAGRRAGVHLVVLHVGAVALGERLRLPAAAVHALVAGLERILCARRGVQDSAIAVVEGGHGCAMYI